MTKIEPARMAHDTFQCLILREVTMADGLLGQINAGDWAERLAPLLGTSAGTLVTAAASGTLGRAGGQLLKPLTKELVVSTLKSGLVLSALAELRGRWRKLVGTKEDLAHSYCRSALAFALVGDYAEAEAWLQRADEQVGDLARPRFIRGLMAGAQSDLGAAKRHLNAALEGRAKPETHARIREALAEAQG